MSGKPDLFYDLKEKIRESLDPVYWCEKYLYLDGKPFRISDNGWKPYVDLYRYLAITAPSKDGKPVVFCKSRQVAGTTTGLNLELYLAASGKYGRKGQPPIRIMHCFPLLETAARFSKTKFSAAVASSMSMAPTKVNKKAMSYLESRLDPNVGAKDSLSFKQFAGGSHVFIEGTGYSSDRLRGITCDFLIADEVQDMQPDAISNAVKSLISSSFGPVGEGMQFYFGTPKRKGSAFEKMWEASSKQYFHLGCDNCLKWFPLYTPGSSEWEKIWIDDKLPKDDPNHGFIVKCIHCGHEQNKIDATMRGKWVASKDADKCKYTGYHLNQLYVPTFPRWRVVGEKPENHPVNTERAYQNEVLGEFYSGTSSPMTEDIIYEKCGERGLTLRPKITLANDEKTFLGIDWGDKSDQSGGDDEKSDKMGKSYCCATVLLAKGSHLEIIWTERFIKTTPEYKRERTDQLIRNFQPTLAICDIGHGGDITYDLQQKYGDKFLGARGLGNLNKKYKFKDDQFPKLIEFDTTHVLEEVFSLFNKGIIKFPLGSFDRIGWLIQHCCSMEYKSSLDRMGNTTQRIIKGSRIGNDGLMSLLYAVMGYNFLKTTAFTNLDPRLHKDITKKTQPLVTVGYMPKWK